MSRWAICESRRETRSITLKHGVTENLSYLLDTTKNKTESDLEEIVLADGKVVFVARKKHLSVNGIKFSVGAADGNFSGRGGEE